MRVLMVQTFHYYRGGDSTYMFNLTRLLESRGHEVVPFAMRHPDNLSSPWEEWFTGEIDFPALLARRSPRAAWTVVSKSIHNGEARRKIAALADRVKPDVAHFHNIHGHLTTSIVQPLVDRGIPIVWTLHDYRQICPNTSFLSHGEICERCLPNRFWEVLVRRCKKESLPASLVAMLAAYWERMTGVPGKIARFVTPSRFLAGKLGEGGFDPARIVSIPNFVDVAGYAGGKEKGYYLYFGRLSREKGVDLLVRAAARVGRSELRIVGDGPEAAPLRDLADRVGADTIRFTGYLSGDALREALAGASFVVLPSRWYENLPFSIMEAFASGKPVVATDIGGIPEMVDDGENGLLFPLGDEAALADRIGRLLDDDALRRAMGRSARAKAGRLWNGDTHYERIMDVYRAVVVGAPGSSSASCEGCQ